MNKKGFTLVEVIGVLTLLTIIILVAFPSILGAMQKADKELDEATREMLIANAKSYWDDTTIRIEEENKTYCVTVKKLIKQNYTKTPISTVDSKKAQQLEDDFCVKTTYSSGKWNYTLVAECSSCS